jgi:hypothetical protein
MDFPLIRATYKSLCYLGLPVCPLAEYFVVLNKTAAATPAGRVAAAAVASQLRIARCFLYAVFLVGKSHNLIYLVCPRHIQHTSRERCGMRAARDKQRGELLRFRRALPSRCQRPPALISDQKLQVDMCVFAVLLRVYP